MVTIVFLMGEICWPENFGDHPIYSKESSNKYQAFGMVL